MKHEIQPVATFGDLVLCSGYGNNLFAVEAYYYEYYYEPGAEMTEVVYDLTCVYGDSGYIIADQDDVSLACKAEKADVFLQAYEPAPTADDTPSWMRSIYYAIGNGGEVEMVKKPTKVAKALTKQAQIDALLDELDAVIQTRELMREIGHADASEYERRAGEIKGKLAEVSG